MSVLLAAACESRQAAPGPVPAAGPPETRLDSESARRGEAVYRRENCGRCHTLYGDPRQAAGDPASRVGPDLAYEGHRRSDDWQYAHLYAPGVVVRGSSMPASRHLFAPGPAGRPLPTPEAVDLVAYLQALGRGQRDLWAEFRSREPDIPPPPPVDEALLSRGADLYRVHCSACHGEGGDGRGEAAGLLALAPRNLVEARYRFKSTPAGKAPTDADLFRVITLGTGIAAAMPAFSVLEPRDRWALVLRVKEFSPALRDGGLRLRDADLRPGNGAGNRVGGRDSDLSAEGGVVWGDLGCAGCHGPGGRGLTREEAKADWVDADGFPVAASGDLTHPCALRAGASGAALERSVLYGVGLAMPAYGEAIPEPRARAALRSFLLSLQEVEPAPDAP